MSPTHDHRPGRDDVPTVREIAELTARLRDLSGRGRDVDPHERAALLAYTDALLARITNSQHDDATAAGGPQWPQAGPPERFAEVEIPVWTREQARRTEAAAAAGTAPPAKVDDAAEIAARAEALREQIATRDRGLPTVWECERPARAVPSCQVEVDEEARRDQLTRWHTDDTAQADSATNQQRDVWDDGPGLP